MRLWTIQPAFLYGQIKQTGFYHCDANNPEVALEHYFDDAYDWLAEQMKKRIGNPPAGVKYPVWAWHTWKGTCKRPDLRYSGHAKRGTPCVLLEIEIPDEQVVLTDFDTWHFVLNKWYYCDTEEESDYFETIPKEKQAILMKQSWLKVFDVAPFNNKWIRRGESIQATFWELRFEHIVKYKYFIAK
jgi:hypothetical protein